MSATEHREVFIRAIKSLETGWPLAEPVLRATCHKHIAFQDPMINVRGIDAFLRVNEKMLKAARHLEVQLHNITADAHTVFATWTFVYTTFLGISMRIEGVSHAKFQDGVIAEQRDYWDIAGGMLSAVPGLRNLHGWLRKKVA